MKNKKFLVLGIALIVAIFLYLAFKKQKEDAKKEEEAKKEGLDKEVLEKELARLKAIEDLKTSGTGGTGGTPPPPPPTGTTKPYKEYDPNGAIGAGILKFKMEEFLNNDTAMYQIKKDAKTGSRLMDGVSNVNYTLWGRNSSPQDDIYNFIGEIGGGTFNKNDYGTYPVFTSLQYPNLAAEMNVLGLNTWVTNDDRAFWDRPQSKYAINSLGGVEVLAHFGTFERRHVWNTYRNAMQFSRNYVAEMTRLKDIVEDAAIRSLKEVDNIHFIGINA